MNLRDEILREHSKKQTMKVVAYVGNNQKRFDELVKLFLGNEYRVTQRAAWALSYCGKAHPGLLKKHLKNIVFNLQNDVNVAVKRNTVRVLQHVDIPEKLQGIVTEVCFEFLNSSEETIAVKAFSMTVLGNICEKHPELAHELKLSIEAQLPFGSAGFHSRAKKELKRLQTNNSDTF